MILKGACLGLGLLLGANVVAYAAPLPPVSGLSVKAADAGQVRYRYRHWRGRYLRGPYWVHDFWGRLRYVGPNSNRAPTHQY